LLWNDAFPATENCDPLAVTAGAVTTPRLPVKVCRLPEAVEVDAVASEAAAFEAVAFEPVEEVEADFDLQVEEEEEEAVLPLLVVLFPAVVLESSAVDAVAFPPALPAAACTSSRVASCT